MSKNLKLSYKNLWIGLGIVIFISAIICFVILFTPKSESSATIKIPHNATEAQVKDSLSKYFDNSYAAKVIRISGFFGFNPGERNGAYRIEAGTSPLTAARKIARGLQTPVKVTINGFRNQGELLRGIAAKFEFSEKDLTDALYNSKFLNAYGLDKESSLCLFLNDTYEFYWSDSPDQVLKKIGDNYSSFWNDENVKKAETLGISPKEAVIIASITDEETTKADEKGKISRLYINRLQKGMRLQADPTVRFALGDFTIKRVTGNMLHVNSPYNTYRNTGVPPGAIRTVGKKGIEALLNSEPSDYLYMCARPDFSGYHDFSKDFDTHKINAQKYRSELDRRNIIQ